MLFLIAITLAAIVKVLAIVLLFNRFKKKRSNVKPSTFKIRTYRNQDMNYSLANNPEIISQRTNSIGVWCTIGTFRCNENCIENLTGAILTCRCAGVSGKELVFWTAKLHTIFNSTIIKIAHCDATHERNSTNANIRAISFFTIVFVNIELVDLGKHILFYIRVYVINNVVAKQRQSTATLDNHKQSLLWIKYCVNNIQMDFTYCEFPSTVSIDTFKAYFDASNVRLPKIENLLSEVPTEDQAKQVKTLRHLVLDAIVSNWSGKKNVKGNEGVLSCFPPTVRRVATLPSAVSTAGQKLPTQSAGYAAAIAVAQLTDTRWLLLATLLQAALALGLATAGSTHWGQEAAASLD